MQHTLKWDMLDAHLPWRYYVSECIRNFHFPLWNPYQDFGYPIHADLRSIWPPEIWIMSLFGGYSIYTLNVLFIFYTAVAGFGMMFLANRFLKNKQAAFYTGLVYMLSGYLTGRAQELYTINSFAFLPLVLYNYFKFYDEISVKRSIYFILFIFLFITSSYQAHTIILFYLMVVIFLYHGYKFIKEKNYKSIKRIVWMHLAMMLILIILLLPLITTAYQVLPWVKRLNSGVAASNIAKYPFSPQCLLSLIVPFAVIRDKQFFMTDLSMTNLYFGLFPLVFMVIYFFKKKKNPLFNLLLGFGIFSLIASFGAYTPLRKILFYSVPLMNSFRGSAYFRLFALIPFVIAGGYIINEIAAYKKRIIQGALLLTVIVFVTTIYAVAKVNFHEFSFFHSDFSLAELLTDKSGFYENLLIQGVVQILFMLGFLWMLIKDKASFKNVFIITLINMIMAVQFNIHKTVILPHSPKEVNAFLSGFPKGFPIPERRLIKDNTDKNASKAPLWRNTNIFAKRVSEDGFNSFGLDKMNYFQDSLTALKDSVINNELFYFSNQIKPLSAIDTALFNHKTLFIADSLFNRFNYLQSFNQDTVGNYEITKFEPNRIEVSTSAKKETFLTLIQSNYKGWHIFIDKSPAELIESNTLFISVLIPKGNHSVTYVYRNSVLIKVFILSAWVLAVLLILAFYFFVTNKKRILKA